MFRSLLNKTSLWIVLLAIAFSSFDALAQNQADSLLRALEHAEGKQRVELLNELSFEVSPNDPEQGIRYANDALELARELNYPQGVASALHKLAVVYRFQGFYDQAVTFSDSALALLPAEGWEALEASIQYNLGVSLRSKGNSNQALEAYQRAIDLYRELGNKPDEGAVLNSVGVMFMYLEDYDRALSYYRRALDIQREADNLKEVANTLNNFAIVYANLGALDSSLHYFEQSLEIERLLDNKKGISESINNIGAVYYYMGDFEGAIGAFRESYTLDSLMGNEQGMVLVNNNIAEMYSLSGQPDKAIELLNLNIKRARAIDSKFDLEVAYQNLTEAHRIKGDYQAAFEVYERYVALHDTILSEQQQEAIAEMETRFRTKEKDQEIRIQTLEIEEQQAALKARTYLIGSLVIVLFLLILAGVFGYQSIQSRKEAALQRAMTEEQEKRLQAVIEATESERRRIAQELHDGIGQQLAGIKLGLNVEAGKLPDENSRIGISKIQKVVDDAAADVRDLSHQMMPRALSKLGLVPALEDMLAKSLGLAEISYTFDEVNARVRFSERLEVAVFRIAQELVSNIIRHAEASEVSVQLIATGKRLQLIIEDNGKGISSEPSSGHGMRNMETRARGIGGDLIFESGPSGKGTTATLIVPLEKPILNEENVEING